MQDRFLGMWTSMKNRCGKNNTQAANHYKGVEIYQPWVEDWRCFREAMLQVENNSSRDTKGRWFCLDKDLLSINSTNPGYFPDTVCFLPRELNQILQLGHPKQRKHGLPLGVSKCKYNFKAQISVNGKPVNLGTRATVEECEILYKIAKAEKVVEAFHRWRGVLPPKIFQALEIYLERLKPF
jgi:hypothetical protein